MEPPEEQKNPSKHFQKSDAVTGRSRLQIDRQSGEVELRGYHLTDLDSKKARLHRPKARAIARELGQEVLNFLGRHVDVDLPSCEVTKTDDIFNIAKLERFKKLTLWSTCNALMMCRGSMN